jgi:uncharacterized membrane protein
MVALDSEALIAPPSLIFLVIEHWMALSILVLLVCSAEFVWKRTTLTILALIAATLLAALGDWMPGRGSVHAPIGRAHQRE